MSKSIRVMGLDPAFANVGVFLAEVDLATGSITGHRLELITNSADKANKKVVRKNSDDLRRAKETVAQLQYLMREWEPSFIFAEIPSGAQSARAAWALGIAVGVLAGLPCPIIQLLPREVKEVTGQKHPDKQDMMNWAYKAFPDLNWITHKRGGENVPSASKNEHLADACAVTVAGVATDEFKSVLSMIKAMAA